LDSGGFFAFFHPFRWPGKPRPIAGHRGVALLNDALLRRLPGLSSGRIAQLVEQMTLNHRVPGSSPGAPTKLFNHLAEIPRERRSSKVTGEVTTQLVCEDPSLAGLLEPARGLSYPCELG